MDYRADLNEKQIEAVTTESQHTRVIAGAGSGKTRVLTYRISYLISELNVLPWTILAITFTNKVANEMKQRVLKMVPNASRDLTIKTFHSFSALFLRQEINSIGFPTTFTIIDEEDQTKLVKDIAVSMGFKRSDKIVEKALSYIASSKLKELYPEDIKIVKPRFEDERTCLEIYTQYEEEKNRCYSLDFDDLILKTIYILEHFPDIKNKWRHRIDHILIDEFQDTNDVEYKLVKLLKNDTCSLYVVGDPDQTIYTWRGANQDIILNLEKDFDDMETIVLERNYRSTQTILDSANKLISNNKLRVKKNLYTESKVGEKIEVKCTPTSKGEADYVAREIMTLVKSGKAKYSDIAVLYRSNYITMDFEAAFTARGIPYQIFGGQKFYQRREIKDVLAYFHLLTNKYDNLSLERIYNIPRRGIGEATWLSIKQEAKEAKQPLYDFLKNLDTPLTFSVKSLNTLKAMIMLLEETKQKLEANEEVFSKTLEEMVYSLGYYEYLKKDDDADERMENVKALFEDIRHYLKEYPDSSFDEYLQNISLLSSQDEVVDGDFVTMMTVHTAKGLEYPIVFVIRLSQAVFPNARATLEGGFNALEEERRLAYVAFTRAMRKLYLTCTTDYSYVQGGSLTPSQFLKESGNEIINTNSYQSSSIFGGSRNQRRPNLFDNSGYFEDEPNKQDFSQEINDVDNWAVGDIVIHKTLGKGVVIALEGDGIIQVRFEQHGIKSIMGNHPAVTKGGHEA